MKYASSRNSSGILHALRKLVFGRIRLSKNGGPHVSFGEPSRHSSKVDRPLAQPKVAAVGKPEKKVAVARPSAANVQDQPEVTEVGISQYDTAVEYELTNPAPLR